MDLKNISDESIFDFLMTSDYNEQEYSIEELKYMLVKFKYFVRLTQGRNENKSNVFIKEITDLKSINVDLSNKIENINRELKDKEYIVRRLKSRRLTIKERLLGKIICKEDENK